MRNLFDFFSNNYSKASRSQIQDEPMLVTNRAAARVPSLKMSKSSLEPIEEVDSW